MQKTIFRISFEDGETLAQSLQPIKTCFCNRDLTEKELKSIITKLKEKSNGHTVFKIKDLRDQGETVHKHYTTAFDKDKVYVKDGKYLYNHGKDGYYDISTHKFVTKEKPDLYIDHSIFKSSRSESIQASDRNYTVFTEHLNCTFTTYDIKTCIQKIHFLAQCYHESLKFKHTVEKEGKDSYEGGKDFKGRGLIQVTHDNNYLKYYDEQNSKKYYDLYKGKNNLGEGITEFIKRKDKEKVDHKFPENFVDKTLKPFAKKLATELKHACYSSGFFWKSNNLNKYANLDNSTKVSEKINKYDTATFPARKKYTTYLKEIFDYDNCKNKK